MRIRTALLLVGSALLLAAPTLGRPAPRATITSVASGPWNAGATWSGGTVPTSADAVRILNGHTVRVNGVVGTRTLRVEAGATLQNVAGAVATVQVVQASDGIIPTSAADAQMVVLTSGGTDGVLRSNPSGGALHVEVWGDLWNEGIWSPASTALRSTTNQWIAIPGMAAPGTEIGWDPAGSTLHGKTFIETASNIVYARTPLAFDVLELRGARLEVNGSGSLYPLIINQSIDGWGASNPNGSTLHFDRLRLAPGAVARRVAFNSGPGVRVFGDGQLLDAVTFPSGGRVREALTIVEADPPAGLTNEGTLRTRRTLTAGTLAFFRASVTGGTNRLTITHTPTEPSGFGSAVRSSWELTPEVGSAPLPALTLAYAQGDLNGVAESGIDVYWRPTATDPWQTIDPATVTVDAALDRVTITNAPNFGAYALADYGPEFAGASLSLISGAWTNPAVWQGGRVPTETSTVVVRSADDVQFSDATIERLHIEPDGAVSIVCCSSQTLTVTKDFTNEGAVRGAYGYSLYLRVGGDIHNEGTWAALRTTLIGSQAQTLSQAGPVVFGGEWVEETPASPLVAGSELAWDWTVELRGGRLEMGAHELRLTGGTHFSGFLSAGSPVGTIVTQDTLRFGAGRTFWHTRVEGAPVLAGYTSVGDGVTFASSVVVAPEAILEMACCSGRTLTMLDGLTNHGTIQNSYGYALGLRVAGPVRNEGTWAPSQTALTGTAPQGQTLWLAAGHPFDGNVWEDTPATPLVALTDLHFTGRVDLRGSSLTMGARRLTLTGGDYLSSFLEAGSPYGRILFDGGTLDGAPSRSFWHTRVEGPVTLVNYHSLGDGVTFAGPTTTAPGSVVEMACCSARTIVFESDLTNFGDLRSSYGYGLSVEVASNVTAHGRWRPALTTFTGTGSQTLAAQDSTALQGQWRFGSGAAREIVAASDLRFDNRVELRGSRLTMGAHRLRLIGNDYLSGWLDTTSPRGVISFTAGGVFDLVPTHAVWDTRIEGPVSVTGGLSYGDGVTFGGQTTIATDAVVQHACCAGRTLTFEGPLVNLGTVQDAYGYGSIIRAYGDLTNDGTWTPSRTDLAGVGSQTLTLGAADWFGGRVLDETPDSPLVAGSDLHFTGRIELNGTRLVMGSRRLRLTGGDYLTGWNPSLNRRAVVTFDAGGVLEGASSRSFWDTRVVGTYALQGTHDLGDGVTFAGTVEIAPDAVLEQTCCSARSVLFEGALVNRGTLRSNHGYAFNVDVKGGFVNSGTWTDAETRLLGSPLPRTFDGTGLTGPIVSAGDPVYVAGASTLPRLRLLSGARGYVLSGSTLTVPDGQLVIDPGASLATGAGPAFTRSVTSGTDTPHVFLDAEVVTSTASGLSALTVTTDRTQPPAPFGGALPIGWTFVPSGAAAPTASGITFHYPDAVAAMLQRADGTAQVQAYHSSNGGATWTALTSTHDAFTRTVTVASAPASGLYGLGTSAPPVQPFVVVTPGPLATYAADETFVLEWTSPPGTPGRVRTEILNAAGTVVRVVNANTLDIGKKNVTLDPTTTPPGAGYRFRITSLTYPGVQGVGAPFEVLDPARALRVSSPAAGATIGFGASVSVSWAVPPTLPQTGRMGVFLVRASVPTLRTRLGRLTLDGSGVVVMPASGTPGDDYRLEFVSEADSRYWGRSAPFSLGDYASIAIAAPTATASWPAGSEQAIAWTGAKLDPQAYVFIDLFSPERVRTRLVRTRSASATGGTWTWAIPASLAPGSGYKVRILYAGPDGQLSATSRPFTIAPPSLAASARATVDVPDELTLDATRPNPTRGAATVRFGLPEAGPVRVAVYDVLGREVAVLADADREAGWHEARIDDGRLAPGVYVVRLEAGPAARVRSMTVVR